MKTFSIKTFGCQMNESDSERIASFLESLGLKEVKEISKADLVVFNTCGVRQSAENRVFGQVHNLRKFQVESKKLKIVITGCLAHRKDVLRKLKDKADFFFPISEFKKFEKWILSSFAGSGEAGKIGNYLKIKPKYKHQERAFVPIMSGCNNFCAYCVVPYARGREWSRPIEEIFKEIYDLSEKGCQEITLLGQNVNSYRFAIDDLQLTIDKITKNKSKIENRKSKILQISFPILLDLLATAFPKVKFNFLTSHPKDYSDELIDVIAKHPNISREIHLPVQSGSNKILKKMNRPYTRAHYLKLIKKTKKKIPDARFSTDVIVGFPGETEKDFQDTTDIFKKVGFFEAYVNKYSPRPGTAAFKLTDNIPWEEKKRREKDLKKLIPAK